MKAELLILGILHRGDMHPYEIKRRLTHAMVDRYVDIDVGTLYYAVRQLAKEGHIMAVGEERVARGGARTVYSLTDSGRERFSTLMVEQFSLRQPAFHPLHPAMLFLHRADPAAILPLLTERMAAYREGHAMLSGMLAGMGGMLSTGSQLLMEHCRDTAALEVSWLQRVIAAVQAGARDADISGLASAGLLPADVQDKAPKTEPNNENA